MADHLRLSNPEPLDSNRGRPFNPDQPAFDRGRHATTLAGILAGLENTAPGIFPSDEEEEDDDFGRIVLKFTGRNAFAPGPFNSWEMIPLGTNDSHEYFVLTTRQARVTMSQLVAKYGTESHDWTDPESWRKQLDLIEGVELYGEEDRLDRSMDGIDFATPQTVDVVLWPTSLAGDRIAEIRAKAHVAEIEELVRDSNSTGARVRVVATDTRPDTLMVRVMADKTLLNELLRNPLVQLVRGPLRPLIDYPALSAAPYPDGVILTDGEPIGVIDDLVVSGNPWLQGVVAESVSFPAGHIFSSPTVHGTQVAGIAAYGNLDPLVTGGTLDTPHPIYAVRIMEANPLGHPEVVGSAPAQLRAAFEWLAERSVRVVVCSINYPYADHEPLQSELTAEVDNAAREFGMVIVVSAGNLLSLDSMHWKDDYPRYLREDDAHLAVPAGSAIGVTVGAIAQRDVLGGPHGPEKVAIARRGGVAPFSRTGPASGGARKPEFAAHGGNWAWDDLSRSLDMRDPNLGVVTLVPPTSGQIVGLGVGTSFAAPYVAREVAKVATRYPLASANLLRAVTALSFPNPTGFDSPLTLRPRVGSAYGMPSVAPVLESSGNRAVLTFEGTIPTGSRVIHRLPVPREFAEGASVRQFRIALAFDPPVRRSRRDYIAGKMHFEFVRSTSFAEVRRAYEAQPSLAEVEANPGIARFPLPSGRARPRVVPARTSLSKNTLIRCDVDADWDPDDEDYFLIVIHEHSPWTDAQKHSYKDQEYALAIDMVDESRVNLDLHALVEQEIELRARQRTRGRV